MPVLEAPVELLGEPGLLIGDKLVRDTSAGTYQHVYAATGNPTVAVPVAGSAEIDQAVTTARAALAVWKAMPTAARRDALLRLADLLRAHVDELGTLAVIDSGGPAYVHHHAPLAAAELFTYNAGWVDKIGGDVVTTDTVPSFDYTRDEPYGVVGVIIPWNGPVHAIGMTCAPALAAGNCVIVKPPELTPFAALRIGQLALEAGLPPGVLQVVPGGAEAGEALVAHEGVDKVHFTGSGAVGQKVLAGASHTLKPVALELGGKSANLIFEDADLVAAAQQALGAVINLSGQGCINGTRVLVQASVYDQVVEIIRAVAEQIPLGDPATALAPPTMGPVINATACNRILGVIDRAKAGGEGRLLAGGARAGDDLAGGYFIQPTVFVDVDNASPLAQEEIFGPVLTVAPFANEDEAIRLANDTRYGLAAYVQTGDVRRAHRVSAALEAGNVWVNGFVGIHEAVPFGGVKQSGIGRLGGIAGIREFSRPKNVWMAL
ncbi:aldehyde dehydrogenase family protein [Pseudofrankia sp. BMG5.36]|uniref:aldehyde dehydrogenase family protein n=1 Tax=Pseudofrankia sp. BMG5.36 TaxID=1834512 RepID=UPI0008DB09E5|nr:aldehyde dehydrogenase family protein [Pseudofrankia sp. BMG5.36]OHV44534.1 aldehyde dehydrogenase [Pseudofrankia sp. BMG5.36]